MNQSPIKIDDSFDRAVLTTVMILVGGRLSYQRNPIGREIVQVQLISTTSMYSRFP